MDEYWYAKRGGGGVHTPPKMYVGRNSSVVTGAGAAVAAPALSIVDCAGYNYRMGFAQRGERGKASATATFRGTSVDAAASSHGETGREVTATALSQRLYLVEHKVTSHGREGTYATAQVANGEKISLSSQ